MHKRLQAQREAGQARIYKRDGPSSLADEESLTGAFVAFGPLHVLILLSHLTLFNRKDPAQECTAYNYPGLDGQLDQYPPIWQIASIVAGDTEAQAALYAITNATDFPNIPPKGTPQGDFSTVQYNASDPDCWSVFVLIVKLLCKVS